MLLRLLTARWKDSQYFTYYIIRRLPILANTTAARYNINMAEDVYRGILSGYSSVHKSAHS